MVYVDLDGTLIYADEGPIQVRPLADQFLYAVSELGSVVLLTYATRGHADRALSAIGRPSRVFKRIISREDLQPIIAQLEAIDSVSGVSGRDRLRLYREIRPIEPSGFMIDDWEVWSKMYWVKSLAIGIGPEKWIQVRAFEPKHTRGSGLEEAYHELVRRIENRR